MLIRHVTTDQLIRAAASADVRLYQLRPSGRGFRVTLKTNGRPPRWGRRGFSRNRNGERCRAPSSVCWHGHRAFMRAVYAQTPTAVFITGLARFNSAEHFEATHAATGDHPVGSPADPVTYADLCDCPSECGHGRPDGCEACEFRRLAAWESTTTPEDTLDCADDGADGIDPARWAEFNRAFNAVIAGRPAEEATA